MNSLNTKHCIPYSRISKPLVLKDVLHFKDMLKDEWQVHGNKKLSKEFHFKDFKSAMAFVNEIAIIADNENHHPDICISHKKVLVELCTHVISGLSENDFIIASKIDEL